ncbi:hypothetical protein RFI_18760 [Reticulomyxa filosa]|uniref:Uncharacterized protein n=1 Tax=Reticulomyxa filosa TaxID=46433 RepID=X6MWX5_RETFI|nr:hypothetical protein RFI_18760 [Reticulomyxa filosa]|eukprot:ETO18503.1 hypothetical protein RFI_18760 [Reticulomyxa filosa]
MKEPRRRRKTKRNTSTSSGLAIGKKFGGTPQAKRAARDKQRFELLARQRANPFRQKKNVAKDIHISSSFCICNTFVIFCCCCCFALICQDEAVRKRRVSLRVQKDKFKMKFKQRPSQGDVVSRGLIHPEYFDTKKVCFELTESHYEITRKRHEAESAIEQSGVVALSNVESAIRRRESIANKLPNPYKLQIASEYFKCFQFACVIVKEEMKSDPEVSFTMNMPNSLLQQMQQERAQNNLILNSKPQPTPSQSQFNDRQLQTQNRRLSVSELAVFFKSRPEVASLFARGIMKAGVLQGDATGYWEQQFQAQRQGVRNTLSNKLDKRKRPSQLDLELRGIVPPGYFRDVVTTMSSFYGSQTLNVV